MNEDMVKTSVSDLEKEVTCAICRDFYDEPKVLPCCHYYCRKCIYNIALRTGLDQPFPCPECRVDTQLPQSSVDKLPTAFFIRRMQDLYSKLKQAQTVKAGDVCEMCTVGSGVCAYCQQCSQFICEKCVESHQRMKMFLDHTVIGLDKVTNENILIPESAPEKCGEHGQPMSLYCFGCSCFICRDCTIKDHFNHSHQFIGKAALQVKEALVLNLKPLKSEVEVLSNSTEEILAVKSPTGML